MTLIALPARAPAPAAPAGLCIVRVPTDKDRQPVAALALDGFETGLLAVIRHLGCQITGEGRDAWRVALAVACERWGQADGAAVVLGLMPVLDALATLPGHPLRLMDPMALPCRDLATPAETALLGALHAMRRDLTGQARARLADLTGERPPARLVQAMLALAARHPAGPRPMAVALPRHLH
jgi:hypothetical protein